MEAIKKEQSNDFNELEQFYEQKKSEENALRKLLEELEKEHQKIITNLKTKKK
jgi:hypothetical protein